MLASGARGVTTLRSSDQSLLVATIDDNDLIADTTKAESGAEHSQCESESHPTPSLIIPSSRRINKSPVQLFRSEQSGTILPPGSAPSSALHSSPDRLRVRLTHRCRKWSQPSRRPATSPASCQSNLPANLIVMKQGASFPEKSIRHRAFVDGSCSVCLW